MAFAALVVDKDAEGATSASLRDLELSDLPEGEVTVAVEHSTLNYKDGLALTVQWYRDNRAWWEPLKAAAATARA